MEKENQILCGIKQLTHFGKFLESHSNKLNDILQKLDGISFECNTNGINTNQSNLNSIELKQININYSGNKENLIIFKLVDSDNKIFNKIILTFLHLNLETKKILKDCHELQQKFLYYDEDICSGKFPINPNDIDDFLDYGQQHKQQKSTTNENIFNLYNTEDCLIKISNYMEFLCNIQFCINGLLETSNVILQQLTVFNSYDKKSWGFNYNFTFEEMFDTLEKLMIEIIKFDEILVTSNFQKIWPSYKKTLLQSFQKHSKQFKQFNCNENEIVGIINVLNELEILFTGNIFQTFLDNTYRTKERLIQNPKGLGQLSATFLDYIKDNLQRLRKLPIELCEFSETHKLIGINSFIILHHQFFGQIDQKLFRQLMDVNQKHSGIILISNIVWCPEVFINKHAETLMVGGLEKYFQEAIKSRQLNLQNKIINLPKSTKNYHIEITIWLLKINTAIKNGARDLKIDQYKNLCLQFLQGIQYAGQLSYFIKSIINLHKIMQLPINLDVINNICKLIILLKQIKLVFSNNYLNIAKIVKHCKQCIQYKCLHMIISTKKKYSAQDTLKNETIDILSALKILEKTLNGPPTQSRLFIVKFLIESQTLRKQLQPEDYDKLLKNIDRVKGLTEFQQHLNNLTDTTFFYWHQTMLDNYMKQIIDKNVDIFSFGHIFKIYDDCSQNLEKLGLKSSRSNLLLKKNNYDQLKSEIISKLCGKIETFLRLEVHKNLQLEQVNPIEQQEFGSDNRVLMSNCNLLLNGDHISIKYHIENYLSNMFYNLTTIYLHDWKTYEEMRQLAKFKYDLVPVEDQLPTQSLEQGIDVLEIMRNIHVFVTKYHYNMNNQYFLESSSNNKYLNTIGISHVANSLKTHGAGIINTTVNFSYQFLRQKFYTFSQFLYDEQINSRLMKENRFVWESKRRIDSISAGDSNKVNENKFVYNYDRAEDFNKEIKKLGLSNDGLSYLDLFRQLITQVGNTMGYIRLIRSGNVHANYTATIHLPHLNTDLNFTKLCEDQKLSSVTKQAAEILEANIKNYKKFSDESSDFFKVLVNAFKPFFLNQSNMHLKNFYLIVPSLILNYVEYILNAREKITKKEKYASCLFDDGFPMGLAYILKISNQFNDFETLQFFKSIESKFQIQHKEVEVEMMNNKDESLIQSLTLVDKRMKAKFREYSLLYDSFYSAKIFFQ